MYVNLRDDVWSVRDKWTQLDITPANCRRSKGEQQFYGSLDILTPGIKDILPRCRKHTIPRLAIPALYVGDGDALRIWLYYRSYANLWDIERRESHDDSDTYACLRTFCTNEEMSGLLKLRYPKMTAVDIAENLVWWRNMEYRNLNTGLLYPYINIPEPYKSKPTVNLPKHGNLSYCEERNIIMRIYYTDKNYKHIVIVPREFKPVNEEALEIVSSEIEEAVREAGDFVGSLVLHTPFKDGLGCFIAAQTRKEKLLDKLVQRDDLFGILPVELQIDELCMLYTVLHPNEEVDVRAAVRGTFNGQGDFLKNFFETKD